MASYAQLLPKDCGNPLAGKTPAEVLQAVAPELKRIVSSCAHKPMSRFAQAHAQAHAYHHMAFDAIART